jgi:uncharacterized repeat protein (TIGR03803 family)
MKTSPLAPRFLTFAKFLLAAAFLAMASPSARAASPYRLLHAFTGGAADGATPTWGASLTNSGSTLYGMTQNGGAYTNGVLFSISTNGGAPKLIHTFNGYSVLNPKGSKSDGQFPVGTPFLSGTTLYGMTLYGGSNGLGSIFSINTDGTGFRILHDFGAQGDGYAPYGSVIAAGSTLFGMTTSGGAGLSEGIVFSINTDGSAYQILHSFPTGSPHGSLLLWGTTLYGMTQTSIFRIETNGASFIDIHDFTGADGLYAYGSLVRAGSILYGTTSSGGANNVGTIFKIQLLGSVFQTLHSFSIFETWQPSGDLLLSGSNLFGMAQTGGTNLSGTPIGTGGVFQIDTNGQTFHIVYPFIFPIRPTDGAKPFGSLLQLGSDVYGMTSEGGSTKSGRGCIFSLAIPAAQSPSTGAPAITTPNPLPEATVATPYKLQLEASGGAAPYTWTLASGRLPAGLTLTSAGLISGKPTTGTTAEFSIKVTGHDKLTSTAPFTLTVFAPDKIAPTLTVTAPKPAQRLTTGLLDISGTAKDNVAVQAVYFQLNNGPWTLAQTADNFALWHYHNLPLAADANTLKVFAVDTSTNYSKTNTINFTWFVTGALIVRTNGSGTIAPNYNNAKLQIGAPYSMIAKPAKGFTFSNWTDGSGTVITNSPTIKFLMASNLTLVANFQPATKAIAKTTQSNTPAAKPFASAAGNYQGLLLHLTLSDSGAFSATFSRNADTLRFTGKFDANGTAHVDLKPAGQPALPTTLQLDPAHQTISARINENGDVTETTAYQNIFSPGQPATLYNGAYPLSDPETGLRGIATIDTLGNVNLIATLPNGATVTQSTTISQDGYWPTRIPTPGAPPIAAWNHLENGAVVTSQVESR